MIDWKPYLEALCNQYAQWWKVYTLTDVVGRQRVEVESPLLLDFMVETVQPAKGEAGEAQQKAERLGVLEGLWKYAADHVLLVGRPGSGKSTALARLLLEEAQASREINSLADSRIPVLVELRYYQTSVLDLIRDFLKQHGLFLNTSEIERLLFEKQFLLLVDGINELPSEAARRDLKAFRQTNAATPMIFTTRDLGVGGDLDIAKKLEMQPLSEAQMQQFVRAYLPQQGEQMLRQLGDRLRELGQTPLLLWMLCSLFRAMGKVPPNLGLVFRQFTQSYYDKLKQDVPVSDESRRWCQLMLQHLAWRMTQGREATELQVAISRHEAEEILTAYLRNEGFAQPRNCAMEWLADLLKYHLLQLGTKNQIEFRHQLIQEHCTAETLLKLLPSLSDDELKREYLNYLKWTEPLALMLELVEDEAQAVRVVKLALEVDLRLGARLAGAVKLEFQKAAVSLVASLEICQQFKILLLGVTRSDGAIFAPLQGIEHEDSQVRESAIYALGQIGSETTIMTLLNALNDENSLVRQNAVEMLGQIGGKAAIPALLQALNDEDSGVTMHATWALEKIGNDAAISALLQSLEHKSPTVRQTVLSVLERIDCDLAFSALFKALNDEASIVRVNATLGLGRLGSMGNQSAISVLLHHALKHQDSQVRERAIYALGLIGSEIAIPALLEAVRDKDACIRMRAASALYRIGDESAIFILLQALKDKDSHVRRRAAEALEDTRSEVAIPALLEALKDKNYGVRMCATSALGNIGSEIAIPALLEALKDEHPHVRLRASFALGHIGSDITIPALLEALKDKDYTVRKSVAQTLGWIGNEIAIPALLEALKDEEFWVRRSATEALEKCSSPKILPRLCEFLLTTVDSSLLRWVLNTIAAIQERCKFYNYTLTEAILVPETQLKIPPIQLIFTSLMHILHLSDLHFGTLDQANLWSNQLAADLYNDINISHLDALILSGDIANYSTDDEYKAAAQFLDNLRQDLPLNPEQIILVPGNHDLNWKLAKKAYKPVYREDYDGQLIDGHYIEESASVIGVRDETEYKQRFAHFSSFYKTIKQNPYPLEYDQQYTLDHLPEQNLLILGLNSAWELDHHYKTRASINTNALSNALTQIRRNLDYKNCLKIAVWHHPLDSAYSDRITDQGFLEQLAVNGFRLFLHGHIHKAETSLFRYDMSSDGRKLDRICAGTFGAPVREWVPGYPLQYNLLKFEDNQLTVYTRRREELNGAWKPDARWLQGAGKTPLDYYAIAL
ncbi:HEAT repeat domain-containing protein [Coleofasciculus sp. FACHB-1120]|uniref:HEAT repeat domain-containing protein n=1 Tax=Coleofasciculus sp. FACHB-1120 TaxID=2692783 RepID=UPI001685D6D3|nr:HEAT repeat domain-containing protein [Coleofasciculus sp. FACHB-1120]MBD2740177.1 HEAT repeat domain-containing protein [Coleofasciculus sp. FACHB-1120]